MDVKEFKEFAKAMADYAGDYLENIRDRPVISTMSPGYLRPLLPEEAPEQPEKWQDVMADIEKVIMPGITHWQSPQFLSYYITGNSYPAIVADMLSGAIACQGFSWMTSPAYTELEVVMMDWLGKMINLPQEFLACSGGKGGGVIQGTASESTLVALFAAKAKIIQNIRKSSPSTPDTEIVTKLVSYCSDQAHSSVERAGMFGGVIMRKIVSDNEFRMRGDALHAAIKKDRQQGLIPFYVVATLGTTNSCAFDCLDEIGPVCSGEKLWLHVDAAYAGSAFICPEFRHYMSGIEHVDTFNFNPHKLLLVHTDCAALWFKDSTYFVDTYKIEPTYLKYDKKGASPPDLRHWQIPFGRRFRSLKLWFVLRLYGVSGLQEYIRKHVALAKQFEEKVKSDDRFELICPAAIGLVCFRLKGKNELNETLIRLLNANGKIYMVPSQIRDTYFIRMAICSRYSEPSDMEFAWSEVSALATQVILKAKNPTH